MDERIAEDADVLDETAPAPYKICVVPSADGTFQVYHEPVEHELEPAREQDAALYPAAAGSALDDERYQGFPSMEEALKEVIRIYKQNPVSGDEQVQFQAGADAEGYEEASR